MNSTRTTAVSAPGIDALVDATPEQRDRAVDFLRAFSIAVVVLWHWVFSVTHWNAHGALTMPNPIGHVPALWVATWFLQIMPLFFFVGGFANYAAWNANIRRGGSSAAFVRTRMRRLLTPVAAFVAVWAGVELVAHAAVPHYSGVLHWGFAVFVPLWFLGVYAAVVCLTPLTMRLHDRAPGITLAAMGVAVALVDCVRFATGLDAIGFVNVVGVFVFVHQLGYWYGDGTLTKCAPARLWLMVSGAIAVLAVLTAFGPYPVSMVTVQSEAGSNMMPPTLCIAVLGVLQAGVALLLRPALNRRLARRRPWKTVVAANSVAMTVFTWHMTAYVLAVGFVHLLGHELGARPTAAWWLERPLWLLLPGAFLAALIATFGRVEVRSRMPITRAGRNPYLARVGSDADDARERATVA